jgi:hypothetical protein
MSSKVDLSVINRLVEEFNVQMSKCDLIDKKKTQDQVVELAKAMGIATAMTLEASALSTDILSLIKINTSPGVGGSDPLDSLSSLFGPKSPAKN